MIPRDYKGTLRWMDVPWPVQWLVYAAFVFAVAFAVAGLWALIRAAQ